MRGGQPHRAGAAAGQVVELVGRYDDYCAPYFVNASVASTGPSTAAGPCMVRMNISTAMKAPIYVYYEIHNFYQNHRRFVKSRSDSQLSANGVMQSDLTDNCPPQLYLRNGTNSSNSSSGNSSSTIFPCGLAAWHEAPPLAACVRGLRARPARAAARCRSSAHTPAAFRLPGHISMTRLHSIAPASTRTPLPALHAYYSTKAAAACTVPRRRLWTLASSHRCYWGASHKPHTQPRGRRCTQDGRAECEHAEHCVEQR